MFCCKSTEDPKKIIRHKFETIHKGVLGGFLIRTVMYDGHFWHVYLRHVRNFRALFREAVSALVKKLILHF